MNLPNENKTVPSQKSHSLKSSMKELATLSMPVDSNRLLTTVDDVLTDAMQTISQSLQQSSAKIEEAKQRLLQDHPSLKQAYETESTQEDELGKLEDAFQDNLMQDQLKYQQNMRAQQEKAQARIASKHQAMTQAAVDLEQKLVAQQKAYQSKILSQTALTLDEKQTEAANIIEDLSDRVTLTMDDMANSDKKISESVIQTAPDHEIDKMDVSERGEKSCDH